MERNARVLALWRFLLQMVCFGCAKMHRSKDRICAFLHTSVHCIVVIVCFNYIICLVWRCCKFAQFIIGLKIVVVVIVIYNFYIIILHSYLNLCCPYFICLAS